MTKNSILVEITRGDLVESTHRGAFVVCDSSGRIVLADGEIDQHVFPRSAVKALQALPLIESGAADAYAFGAEELALACASHNGETRHVATARGMLEAAGLDETALECGPQPPRRPDDQVALHHDRLQPGAVHNNCSGKHAGMLALARHLGADCQGYVEREHPIQREVRAALECVCGATAGEHECGIDGCSIPTYALPLRSLAGGFARFGTGDGLGPERAKAAARLRDSVAAAPFMVAGTGRFCTQVMETLGTRAFVKTGAEGVFCAAFPEQGFGVAVKIDDGASRASEVIMAALIRRFVTLSADEERRLESWLYPTIRNWNGLAVGEIRATGILRA